MRWIKFNAVGILGAGVQLALLWALTRFGMHYLVATAISVEAAILHNFAWHRRWTFADRPGSLLRFQFGNGLLSIASNLVWMKALVEWGGLPYAPANLLSICLTSALNYLVVIRWVFPVSSAPAARASTERRAVGLY